MDVQLRIDLPSCIPINIIDRSVCMYQLCPSRHFDTEPPVLEINNLYDETIIN